MPDITMCKGGDCPLKETCWRYLAVPGKYGQSYFKEIPFYFKNEITTECEYYWETKKRGK